jgi:hypothetical protein
MSATLGPPTLNKVSNLVFYLDASNPSSYPGSGTTWTDVSNNNRTGTLTNGPTFNGSNGGSIVFNGSTQYVDIASSTGLNFTNTSGTISVWCKYSTVNAGGAYLLSKTMDATGGWGLTIGTDGIPYFETKNNISGATACYRYANKAYNDGTWHNIVIVFVTSTTVTSNNTISVYVDGVPAEGTLYQILTYGGNTSSTIQLARRPSGNYYTGNIASVQIYNIGLTATDVLTNYNSVKRRFGL